MKNRANKCLSRMKGNFHVRFLGGKGVAILPTYPLNVPDPIKIENTNDVNCYVCHQDKIKEQELALSRKDPHTERHFQEGMNCVSCHSGIVHDEMKNKVLPSRDRCYTCHLDAMSSLVRRD